MEIKILDEYTAKRTNEIKQQWTGDRQFIALEAINEAPYSDFVLEITEGNELVAIATMTTGHALEINNIATKRPGYARSAMETIAAKALELDVYVKLISSVNEDVQKFYQHMGLEMDDCYYGNEPGGVEYWWETESMLEVIK